MNTGTDVWYQQELRYLQSIHLEWQDIAGEAHLLLIQVVVDRFHRALSLGGNLSAHSQQTINVDLVFFQPLQGCVEPFKLFRSDVHASRLQLPCPGDQYQVEFLIRGQLKEGINECFELRDKVLPRDLPHSFASDGRCAAGEPRCVSTFPTP